MSLPMEMMNPILVDDGVADEGMEVKTLFMEPMGADTLGRFQLGVPRISGCLTPERARRIGGSVRLVLRLRHASIFS